MSYLVDTDVLSDPSRPLPSPKVDAWLAAHRSQIYTSSISIGEIKRGMERLPSGAKRTSLEKWLETVLASMGGRILAYNTRVAETWGEMMANLERQGHPMPMTDSLIAAVAKRHNLTLVTRNIADFAHIGLRVTDRMVTRTITERVGGVWLKVQGKHLAAKERKAAKALQKPSEPV